MKAYHLFEVCGVELEYMLVDGETLDVRPEADRLLVDEAGGIVSEVEAGELTWSNELVLHLVELKVSDPVTSLDGLADRFAGGVRRMNRRLAERGMRLMPSGAHPWMDPDREARLWPHEGVEIYREFDRIFACRSHGWTNVQSMHLNLPFADDEEFGRLHAAIRILLPILPALTASSPFLDGAATGLLDSRLEAYRTNALQVPAVSGRVIPEPVFHIDAYQSSILEALYHAIAPYDTAGILRYEWLNARGAIARFERNSIEIRVMDVQECPSADLAVAGLVIEVLRGLVEERWSGFADQCAWEVDPLRQILLAVTRDAEEAVITDAAYLSVLGHEGSAPCLARDLWRGLAARVGPHVDRAAGSVLETQLEQGPLARRILRAAGEAPDRKTLMHVYRELCGCLAENRPFLP